MQHLCDHRRIDGRLLDGSVAVPVTTAGPLTPYVTPPMLLNAPTGISWSTIPAIDSTPAEQAAEQMNICMRATSMCEAATNNILRATIDTETLYGPDFRITIRPSGVTRVLLSRYPITQVLSGQFWNAASFPPQYVTLAADQFAIERPVIGIYGSSAPSNAGDGGQSILVAPGNLSWWNGRLGYGLEVTYINGWPHCSLTSAVTAGSSALAVDDCTGWAPVVSGGQGALGVIFDGDDQEVITCTAATAQSGPGTLTLATPLAFGHGAQVVVSTFPQQVILAAIFFATGEALVRGATATTIQSISGMGEATASGHYELMKTGEELLYPYRRVI